MTNKEPKTEYCLPINIQITKEFNERWIARIDGFAIDVIEEKTGFGIVHIGSDKELKDCDYPKDRAIANAKLISAEPYLLSVAQKLISLKPIIMYVGDAVPESHI